MNYILKKIKSDWFLSKGDETKSMASTQKGFSKFIDIKSVLTHVFDRCFEKSKDEDLKQFSIKDMLRASKYGYEFRDQTLFPEHRFEDSCIGNTKQVIQSWLLEQESFVVEVEIDEKNNTIQILKIIN